MYEGDLVYAKKSIDEGSSEDHENGARLSAPTKHEIHFGDHVYIKSVLTDRLLKASDDIYVHDDEISKRQLVVADSSTMQLGKNVKRLGPTLDFENDLWKKRVNCRPEDYLQCQWFDLASRNAEFMLMWPSCNLSCEELMFGDEFYIVMSTSCCSERYFLSVSEEDDLAPTLVASQPESRWRLIDHDGAVEGSVVTSSHSVYFQSYKGSILAINDRERCVLFSDIPLGSASCLRYAFNLVRCDRPYQQPWWASHYVLDGGLTLPIELSLPRLFESSHEYEPAAHRAAFDVNGVLNMGAQEILLVEDCLQCLMGVPGEFVHFYRESTSCNLHDAKPNEARYRTKQKYRITDEMMSCVRDSDGTANGACTCFPRYRHKYQTLASRTNKIVEWDGGHTTFDSTLKLDESLKGMTDKIMEFVHVFNAIRDVTRWHLELSATATNRSLGNAMRQILTQYEGTIAQAKSYAAMENENAPHRKGLYTRLTLQKLFAMLDSNRSGILELHTGARLTYGIKGTRLLDALSINGLSSAESSGPNASAAITLYLMKAVRQPLERFLTRWLNEGEVCDPFGEFFVGLNPRFHTTLGDQTRNIVPQVDSSQLVENGRPSLTELQRWFWWEWAFDVYEPNVPSVVKPFVTRIMTTGKMQRLLLRHLGAAQGSPTFVSLSSNSFASTLTALERAASSAMFAHLKDAMVVHPKLSLLQRDLVQQGYRSNCGAPTSLAVRAALESLKDFYLMRRVDFVEDLLVSEGCYECLCSTRATQIERLRVLWTHALRTSSFRDCPFVQEPANLLFSQLSLPAIAGLRAELGEVNQRGKSTERTDRRSGGMTAALFCKVTGMPWQRYMMDQCIVKFVDKLNVPQTATAAVLAAEGPLLGDDLLNFQKVIYFPFQLPVPLQMVVVSGEDLVVLQSVFRLLFTLNFLRHHVERLWAKVFQYIATLAVSPPVVHVATSTRTLIMRLLQNLTDYFSDDAVAAEQESAAAATAPSLEKLQARWQAETVRLSYVCFLNHQPVHQMLNEIFKSAFAFIEMLDKSIDFGVLEAAGESGAGSVGESGASSATPLYETAAFEDLDHELRSVVARLTASLRKAAQCDRSRALLERLQLGGDVSLHF